MNDILYRFCFRSAEEIDPNTTLASLKGYRHYPMKMDLFMFYFTTCAPGYSFKSDTI